MLTPALGFISRLLDKSAEHHAQWLVQGLRHYRFGSDVLRPYSQDAFPGAAAFINNTSSVINDLASVIHVFPKADLDIFKLACARALNILNLNLEADIGIAEDVIYLSVNIRAYEILDVLHHLLSKVCRPVSLDRLFTIALTALKDIAEAGYPDIVECVHALLGSWQPFPPDRASTALLAMTRAMPSDLLDHLQQLYVPMEAYYGFSVHEPDIIKRRRFIILDVGDLFSRPTFLLRSAKSGARCPPDETLGWTDDWWAYVLKNDPDPDMVALRRRIGLPEFSDQTDGYAALEADMEWANETDKDKVADKQEEVEELISNFEANVPIDTSLTADANSVLVENLLMELAA